MSSTFEKRASRDLVAVSEAKFSRLKWRMLLAAMLVLNQNRITDGLNRSPVMLVSLVSFL